MSYVSARVFAWGYNTEHVLAGAVHYTQSVGQAQPIFSYSQSGTSSPGAQTLVSPKQSQSNAL